MTDDLTRERLATLGSLMAGLVHEINTPLAALRSNTDILIHAFRKLEESAGTQTESKDLFAIVQEALAANRLACERLVEITKDVRNFAGPAARKLASLEEIVENALVLAAHEFRERVTVQKDFEEGVDLYCSPGQLCQVFINLLVNAAHAIQGKGEIHVKTRQDGESVRISISDTGHGMSPETQSRIFEAGFTTKAQAGSGLGLSICKQIVENHGGRIEVQSTPGKGATVVIELPRPKN